MVENTIPNISVGQLAATFLSMANDFTMTAKTSNEETWPANRDAMLQARGLDPAAYQHVTLNEATNNDATLH